MSINSFVKKGAVLIVIALLMVLLFARAWTPLWLDLSVGGIALLIAAVQWWQGRK
jgi:hypothetical protein